MKITQKMFQAKKMAKETKHKKEGKNSFSNYDYFTPTQVEQIVSEICFSLNLLSKFDLIRNETGIKGQLSIIDIDSDESIVYEMATAMPEIKATNEAQQLGGCMTYTERYLKMTAFGITDNNLDPDTTENTEKRVTSKSETKITEWLTEENFKIALNSDSKGITATLNAFDGTKGKGMKKEYREQLLTKLNNLKNGNN